MYVGVIYYVFKIGNWRVYLIWIEIGYICDDLIRSFVVWMIE